MKQEASRTMKNLGFVALVSLRVSVSAFSPSHTLQGYGMSLPNDRYHEQTTHVQAATATVTDAGSKVVEAKTDVPVSRISVCAGELCQCQGEEYEHTGGASDAAIEELRALGLPFDVDEVGCLGACGRGTMMAMDFANGDSIMTDGLESTLAELGIERREVAVVSPTATATTEGIVVQKKAEGATKAKKPPMLADTRERMRQEATDEVVNPWMNMASYLAKKAADKVFGSE